VDEDCFLQIGEHYAVRGDGLVIVSAESDARIGIADHSNQVESIGAFFTYIFKNCWQHSGEAFLVRQRKDKCRPSIG
jgi:hypothetical protein